MKWLIWCISSDLGCSCEPNATGGRLFENNFVFQATESNFFLFVCKVCVQKANLDIVNNNKLVYSGFYAM